ncbi:MAG: glycosyltransferase [Patescibacteria group bacterium]
MQEAARPSREISVLMLSLDRGLLGSSGDGGDVRERHMRYAEQVRSLDIVVFGGERGMTKQLSDKLTIHATGGRGLGMIFAARRLVRSVLGAKQMHLIVAQDPHVAGWVGLWAKKRFHLPLLVHLHGDFLKNRHWRNERWFHLIFAVLQPHILRQADGVRAVSTAIQEKLVSLGIPRGKVTLISTPVDEAVFLTSDEKQQVRIEELRYKYAGKFIALFVGRLESAKNIFFMIDVLERLRRKKKEIVLLMIGEGSLREQIKVAIKNRRLEGDVHMLGPKDHAELGVYYRLAHAVLLLSTNESFGKVIIEAGLCGTPTLASQTAGAAYIIEDGKTGFIVSVNDLDATVDVLDEMIDYPEGVKLLGMNAREVYKARYTSERSVQKIVELWASLARA